MGVRCVVAAGWAVHDAAACRFAEDFFEAMVAKGQPFGEAIWEPKQTTGNTPLEHVGLSSLWRPQLPD